MRCNAGAELAFQRIEGVVSTKVGYIHGTKENPTYEQVCSGTTGHAEAVAVDFDASKVTYEALLDLFWDRLGDSALTLNRAGNDVRIGSHFPLATAKSTYQLFAFHGQWRSDHTLFASRCSSQVGTQYRSGIYYLSEEQRKAAEASVATRNARLGRPVVTEVVMSEGTPFYLAEDYHQR